MPIIDALRCTGAREVGVLAQKAPKLASALSTMLGEVLDGLVGSALSYGASTEGTGNQ
jgi:hypothetical protein